MIIKDQVISDPASGLVIKFEDGIMTIWGDPLPSNLKLSNREFFFLEEGSFNGTGTSLHDRPITMSEDDLLGL